jgi:hypothetical protein
MKIVFFPNFLTLLPRQPSHFVYYDAPRIISEFIKISDKMLVLENSNYTPR